MEMVDAARLITLLDEAGIRQAAVLSLAYMYGNPNRPPVEREYDAVKAENDWTSAQVAKFPDRLVAFCSVNPLRPYALEEIARCARDPQLKRGLKLHFGNSDVNLTNPADAARLREVFALANRQRMAIVVHARTTISKQRPYGAEHARVFLDTLLPAAPDVPVQIAHLAGSGGYDEAGLDDAVGVFVDAIAAKDPRVARLWFDVSGIAGIGNWPTAGRARRRAHPPARCPPRAVGSRRSGRRHHARRGVEGLQRNPADAGRARDDPDERRAVPEVTRRRQGLAGE